LPSTPSADRLSPLAGTVAFAALWTSVFYLLSFGANGTGPSWAYSQVGAPVLIQSAARTANATLVIGFDDRSGPERRADAYVVQPDDTLDVYGKRHLVPGLEDGFRPGRPHVAERYRRRRL